MNRETAKEVAFGKWQPILTGMGMPPKALGGNHCPCPLCGGSDRFRFTNYRGNGEYFCNQCGPGDGFDLLMKFNNWDFKTTAEYVEAYCRINPIKVREPTAKSNPRDRLKRMWGAGKELNGSDPATMYLKGRGLEGAQQALRNSQYFRYHEALPYYKNGKKTGEYAALMAKVMNSSHTPTSVHVTYVAEGKKARVESPKKMMPPVSGLEGSYALIGATTSFDRICVSEGIETGILIHQYTGMPVFAALSANGMRTFVPPTTSRHVYIFADNDKSFTGQAAAYELSKRLYANSDAEEVKVNVCPEVGMDYLDYHLKHGVMPHTIRDIVL